MTETAISNETKPAEGGCHCGANRFEISGEPEYVACCHCMDCRKSTGAPMAVFVTCLDTQVRFTKGERSVYSSSPGVARTYCGDCGTPLSYEAEWKGDTVIGFYISTLDKPEDFPPEKHVFDADRISWFHVADDLPRYLTVPGTSGPDYIGPSVGRK